MIIPATAQAWELPAPLVSPGDYKSKTYTTKFVPGNFDDEMVGTTSNKVVYSVLHQGRSLFSQTLDYTFEDFSKPLYPGNYTAQAVWTLTFTDRVLLDSLNGSPSYPTGFECSATETSREPVYYSDGDLNYYRVVGSVTCTEAITGRIYYSDVNMGLDPDESFTPDEIENSTSTYMTLTTPNTWSQTQTIPFTVKAVNSPTVSYDEYSLIKTGMKRSKVEKIFGNTSPVFYRKVKKGSLYIYGGSAYITYKNNKVTNTRYVP